MKQTVFTVYDSVVKLM